MTSFIQVFSSLSTGCVFNTRSEGEKKKQLLLLFLCKEGGMTQSV